MNKKEFFPFLDGFRALGILMVLGHHMCVGLNLFYLFDNDPPILTWIFFKSWQYLRVDLSHFYLFIKHVIHYFKGILGVQIFLMISGFLITRSLLKHAHSWEGIRRFWTRRFFRIFPVYALMVIVSLGLFMIQNNIEFKEISLTALRYLTFLQNYFPRNIYLEHAWTLAIFEQFYFVCPIIIFIVFKFFKGTINRSVALLLVFVLLMCLGATARFMYIVQGKPLISGPLQAPAPYFTLFYHIAALALGCIMAVLEPLWKDCARNKLLGSIFWIIGILGYCILFFIVDWGYHWGDWYLNIIGYLSTLSLFAAAFHGVSFFSRFKMLQWLGRHAYGIYVWHILILSIWAQWWVGAPSLILIFGAFISCLAAGIFSSLTIEKYFLKLRERILKKTVL